MAWTQSPAPLYNVLCDLEHITGFLISISFLKYLLSVALVFIAPCGLSLVVALELTAVAPLVAEHGL